MDEGQMYDENGGYDDYDEAEEVTGALVATRQNKKKAAEDAKLLANRIALLKQEEMKTWKKIEETKKRTTDISGLKKRNEEKVQKKIFDI